MSTKINVSEILLPGTLSFYHLSRGTPLTLVSPTDAMRLNLARKGAYCLFDVPSNHGDTIHCLDTPGYFIRFTESETQIQIMEEGVSFSFNDKVWTYSRQSELIGATNTFERVTYKMRSLAETGKTMIVLRWENGTFSPKREVINSVDVRFELGSAKAQMLCITTKSLSSLGPELQSFLEYFNNGTREFIPPLSLKNATGYVGKVIINPGDYLTNLIIYGVQTLNAYYKVARIVTPTMKSLCMHPEGTCFLVAD